jgi:Flp pilus assembly protein TadG
MMIQEIFIRRLCSLRARFADSRGIAAVEFALILPFMCLLYFASAEICRGVAAYRMTVLSASTVANLVSEYSTISQSQTIPDILNASGVVMTPWPAANAVVTVSLIGINSSGKATVTWSYALNGSPRPTGQVITLPALLDVPNSSIVFGETTYAYTPIADYLNVGKMNLYSSVYMLPRLGGTIAIVP